MAETAGGSVTTGHDDAVVGGEHLKEVRLPSHFHFVQMQYRAYNISVT